MTFDPHAHPEFLDRLEAAVYNREGRQKCGEVLFRCLLDGHEDKHPSARWNRKKADWYCDVCKVGGGSVDLAKRIGVELPPLHPPKASTIRQNGHGRRVVTRYLYQHADGSPAGMVTRGEYGAKSFLQYRWNGTRYLRGLDDGTLPLYHLPELLAADPRRWVAAGEGEKDADRLREIDVIATCNAGGAGKFPPEHAEHFRGRRVAIFPDNDAAGREHAEKVARLATEAGAAEVRVVTLPGLPPKGDISDWLDAGGDKAQLRALIDEAPAWTPSDPEETAQDTSPRTAPDFPIEALPPAIRVYVEAAAESIPVPVEMIAVPLIGGAAALIGNRLHLALKPSYREYLSLYVALVMPPGTAKSPALKLALWPLDVLQRGAMKDYREKIATYDSDLDRWKARKPEERGKKPVRPTLRHYFSSNLTLEALVGMLEQSPGVAIIRDEILSWVRSMDQYRGGKGSDRQEYLSLWAAATIKADRKGGEPIYRPCPVACVVGGIQPDFVAELHDEANRRDGFVERILPVVLDLRGGRWTEATIAPERFADVLAVFEVLDQLPPADHDDDPKQPVGIGVELSLAARERWIAWHDENAALAEEAPALAGGFYRKLPAHVARFALILHALWQPDDPRPMVSVERMADAIEVGEFFREHIDRLLPLFGAAGSGASAARRLKMRILRILGKDRPAESDGWVTRSDIYRELRNVSPDDLSEVLSALQTDSKVERREDRPATKPVEYWRLTPAHYSHYSHYSPDAERKYEYCESSSDPLLPDDNEDDAEEVVEWTA